MKKKQEENNMESQETRIQGHSRSISEILHLPLRRETVTCTTCGGEAVITFVRQADGSEKPYGTDRICEQCRRREALDKEYQEMLAKLPELEKDLEEEWLTEYSGIPMKYWWPGCSYEKFDQASQPEAYKIIRQFEHDLLNGEWDDEEMPYRNMLVMGPYGTGKTHLITSMAQAVMHSKNKVKIDRDHEGYNGMRKYTCPVEYLTEATLLKRIRATFSSDSELTEDDVYHRLFRRNLIVLDEVGKTRPRDIAFTQGVFFNVIDYCYNNYGHIVLSTNLDVNTLPDHIGGACASRLLEMCPGYIVTMKPGDYRLKKAQKQS
ncbi:MAG: ATP-binding protein [Dehalogenimonas sp.]